VEVENPLSNIQGRFIAQTARILNEAAGAASFKPTCRQLAENHRVSIKKIAASNSVSETDNGPDQNRLYFYQAAEKAV
jgi:hypothetical protein